LKNFGGDAFFFFSPILSCEKLYVRAANSGGRAAVRAAHPDVPIRAAAMDEESNDHGHLVPGLGDAGDRTCGTR
jgi:uracil phosphoribosyltransferase